MVLESTMICLDNSDWMLNGDYLPSRLEAQQDAATMLCNDRTNSNPENTVGILTMAGTGVDLLVSPTEEIEKILACFAGISITGKSDIGSAVQIAQLALKHRKNKNGGQRIIAFVGGIVFESSEKLQKIGKQLKKNNVAIDIISMGEIEENSQKLIDFVNATNSNDNSHLITVPPGVSPINALLSSPILHLSGMMNNSGNVSGAGNSAAASGGNDLFDMYGGVDPDMDPELAMAIRVSTEEARAQEEARMKLQQDSSQHQSSSDNDIATAALSSSTTTSGFGGQGAIDEEDEDALMQRALEMSMREMMSSSDDGAEIAKPVVTADYMNDEDEDLQRAMQLSIANNTNETTAFSDPDFVAQMLMQGSGAGQGKVNSSDSEDAIIQAALDQIKADQQRQAEEEDGSSVNKDNSNCTKKRKEDDR